MWDFAPDLEPPRFTAARQAHLAELERTHFWFTARARLLETRLRTLALPEGGRALELGCGSGTFLNTLQRHVRTVVGVEGHIRSLERAAQRAPRACLIHSDVSHVPLGREQFDVIVGLDVLEHVEPTTFLHEAHRLARTSGALLLSVPACAFLWSATDEAAGHRCRYNVRMLRRELVATGWQLTSYTHYQCLLLPALYLSRATHRRREPLFERRPPQWLNALGAVVNSFEVRVFGAHRVPFGSSLIATAQRVDQ